jgi:hypothetical protein
MVPDYTSEQIAIIGAAPRARVYLSGPAGTGKTTAGVGRVLHLIEQGVPAGSVLVLIPQRTLGAPYYEALSSARVRPGGRVNISTMGGLAQRMVELFWPMVSQEAGFRSPHAAPTFLTLETAQYFIARLVRPLVEAGAFEGVVLERSRLYSQILDNLNKAALVGFPHTEIGDRLKAAWSGEPAQARVYDDAQACASLFRQYCLDHNLLDFSLQLEVFKNHLWPLPACRDYLLSTFSHIVADNIEEDTPTTHDILRQWLPKCDSSLLILDDDGGYRRFLGADPDGAAALADLCQERPAFGESFVSSLDLQALSALLARSLRQPAPAVRGDARSAIAYGHHRFHPQMLDWVAAEIATLVHTEGVPPGEIAVLAPFLPDGLRFSLVTRLHAHGIPARSHRPSRALRDEPAARCMLTLAALAHPEWKLVPKCTDVTQALVQSIDEMDLVRAHILVHHAYSIRDGNPALCSFDEIDASSRDRITYTFGDRYERLRAWLAEAQTQPRTAGEAPQPRTPDDRAQPLDLFWSRLFGEVLSQPGFGFHSDYDAGEAAAGLIESARKFRWIAGACSDSCSDSEGTRSLGEDYVEMVQDGVIAAQYVGRWKRQPDDAVLLAPAHTFLAANHPVDYQFWVEVGSRGWWERLNQPLTQPYVLSREWPPGTRWSADHERRAQVQTLFRLTTGLLHRCRKRVYLGYSELSENGSDERGLLLQTVQSVLRALATENQGGHV